MRTRPHTTGNKAREMARRVRQMKKIRAKRDGRQ